MEIGKERLGDESMAHCERTASTAAELATRFGIDPEVATLAGLLHDYARDESPENWPGGPSRWCAQVNSLCEIQLCCHQCWTKLPHSPK